LKKLIIYFVLFPKRHPFDIVAGRLEIFIEFAGLEKLEVIFGILIKNIILVQARRFL
jgi:hypothetical protein